jgi:hypothetical protein
VWVKRSFPFDRVVFFEFHAEKGIRQASEIIIINAGVEKGCWYAKLPYVVLYCELARPIREAWPDRVVYGVIGHTAIDVVLYTMSLSSICQGLAEAYLISGGEGVYKGILAALEQSVNQGRIVFEGLLIELDVLVFLELLFDHGMRSPYLSLDGPSEG